MDINSAKTRSMSSAPTPVVLVEVARDQVAVRLSNMTPCLIGNRKGTA